MYVVGNPINYTDPTGYITEGQATRAQVIVDKLKIYYNANIFKDWGYQTKFDAMTFVPTCEWQEGLWELGQLSTVLTSFNKIRDRLKISETKVAKITGATTFRRVDKVHSWFFDNPVASASPSGLVKLTANAFKTHSLPDEWFVLHELGHIFDFQGIGGNYKSQKFWEEFQRGPCVWSWCPYNPSDDPNTTPYGLKSVLEDFADTFTVSILFNRPYNSLQSQKRLDLMNSLLKDAVNRN